MKNLASFIEYLESVANANEDSLAKFVANEALDRDESEIINWFEDLLSYGCQSGMISSLVYYTDTNAFFDKHYYEIMQLKEEYEDSLGEPLRMPYQMKNFLAWFGFEQTAQTLYCHYESEF